MRPNTVIAMPKLKPVRGPVPVPACRVVRSAWSARVGLLDSGLWDPAQAQIGPSTYWRLARPRLACQNMRRLPSNEDMLAWFSEDERDQCGSCGEKACVSVPHALASFCLACGAITLKGVRIDMNDRLPT